MSNGIDIEALLHQHESTTLDFKQAQYPLTTPDEKSELLKDLLAFANASRTTDAHIIIGAKENPRTRATITGVSHHLDDANLQQLVNSKTNRPLTFSYRTATIENQPIGILTIPVQHRPIYLRKPFGKLQANAVYTRQGSSTKILITPDEILQMLDTTATIELDALATIHNNARFYTRVQRLIEDISHIPRSHLTTSTQLPTRQPPEYEQERRQLLTAFNADYDQFRNQVNTARDLLEPHATDSAISQILTATDDVIRTVETLVADATETYASQHQLPSQHARDAAERLGTLIAQRRIALHQP